MSSTEAGPGAPEEAAVPAAPDEALSAAPPEPVNLDLTGLPPLEYPGQRRDESATLAAQRRSQRLRVEIAGGAVLVLLGVGAFALTRNGRMLALCVLAVLAVAAYEFLVSSLE